MSEQKLTPENVGALFGRTREQADAGNAEHAEEDDLRDREEAHEEEHEHRVEDRPANPGQAHGALIVRLLSTPPDDRAFLDRLHGIEREDGGAA